MKKLMAKRTLAACAVAVLAGGSLVACGSGSSGGEGKSGGSSNAAGATINYWHRLPDSDGMIKVSEAADEFNKDHDFKVKVRKFDGDAASSYDDITNAIKAGNAPCLAQASYDGIPAMLNRGELEDVTKAAAKYKDNYAAGPWGLTSLGGKTYGLPQDTGPLVYFYDKDAFDKLGLQPPKTWEEYWALASKAKGAGKYTSAYLTDDAGAWLAAIASARGAEWFQTKGSGWKVDVESEPSKAVANEFQKSIDEKTTLLVKRWDENDFNTKIADGTLIGYLSAGWDAPLIMDKSGKDKANWQIAQVPGDKTGPWGGSAIVVLKGCKHVDQALEFANWYNTNLKAMASQGLVPAAKGETPKPAWAKYFGDSDVMAALAQANDRMDSNWLFLPTWPSVQKVINDNSAKIGSGTKIADILSAAQKEAVSSLKSSGIKVDQ